MRLLLSSLLGLMILLSLVSPLAADWTPTTLEGSTDVDFPDTSHSKIYFVVLPTAIYGEDPLLEWSIKEVESDPCSRYARVHVDGTQVYSTTFSISTGSSISFSCRIPELKYAGPKQIAIEVYHGAYGNGPYRLNYAKLGRLVYCQHDAYGGSAIEDWDQSDSYSIYDYYSWYQVETGADLGFVDGVNTIKSGVTFSVYLDGTNLQNPLLRNLLAKKTDIKIYVRDLNAPNDVDWITCDWIEAEAGSHGSYWDMSYSLSAEYEGIGGSVSASFYADDTPHKEKKYEWDGDWYYIGHLWVDWNFQEVRDLSGVLQFRFDPDDAEVRSHHNIQFKIVVNTEWWLTDWILVPIWYTKIDDHSRTFILGDILGDGDDNDAFINLLPASEQSTSD